jgi:hypothetical protein
MIAHSGSLTLVNGHCENQIHRISLPARGRGSESVDRCSNRATVALICWGGPGYL